MTTYYDTSTPGNAPLSATGQVFEFGAEVDFYLSVASNTITGQATGPSTQFTIYSRTQGPQTIQVDYGTTNTAYQVKLTGYLINATVPGSGGSVSCRVVVSSEPFPLTVTNVSVTGTVSTNIASVGGVTTPGEGGGIPIGSNGAINPFPASLDSFGSLKVANQAIANSLEDEFVAPTVNPEAGFGETTEQAGSTSLGSGTAVRFQLSCSGIPFTSNTVPRGYFCIKGHTSGVYYATAFENEQTEGEFFMLAHAEKLDLVLGDDSANKFYFAGHWQAFVPGVIS